MSTQTPQPPTTADIFAMISPSVAFVETPSTTGTGVLISSGETDYLVTNAHVVWPYQLVRVVFPDGSEFVDVQVLYTDYLADVAVISGFTTNIEPLALTDGESLSVGSDILVIGYPGETEEFPQPAISRGVIPRNREWKGEGITYFQLGTSLAGGQSGGALLAEGRSLIRITGFTFTEAGFGLVASTADPRPRLDRLIAGEDVAGLGDRGLPKTLARASYDCSLQNR